MGSIHNMNGFYKSLEIRLKKIKMTELIITEMLEEVIRQESCTSRNHSKISKFKTLPH